MEQAQVEKFISERSRGEIKKMLVSKGFKEDEWPIGNKDPRREFLKKISSLD